MESQAQAAPVIDVESAGNAIADKMEAMEVVEPVKEVEAEEIEPSIEASDTEEAETDATEEQEESAEDSSESESDPETEEPAEEEAETYESIADLAEATGMEVKDFLDTVKQKVKINGEEMEVSLADLTAGYQMEQDYRRKTTELSEQRKGFEQEKEQASSQLQSKFQEAEAITANLEKQLMGEYNNIDWNQLEVNDREEWLVQRQKFSERAQQLEGTKAQIQSELQQRNQEAQAKHNERLQAQLAKEGESMLQAIPEWADKDVMDAEQAQMRAYAQTFGYSEEETYQISDHRLMRMLQAMTKSQATNQKIDVAKKKVKKLPKIVKPSAKTDKRALKQKQSSNSWNQYKTTGSMDDLGAHIASKIK